MRNGILQHLRPFEKLIFFIVFCVLSAALFSLLSVGLASKLFGVSSVEAFNDITNPHSIRAVKFVNLFFHLGAFIFPAIIFSKLFAHNPQDYLFLERRPKFGKIILILILLLGLIFSSNLFLWLNRLIDFSFLPEETYQNLIFEQAIRDKTIYAYIGGTSLSFLSNVFLLALVPAIGEELVFRGVLQNLLAKATGKIHFAVWVSAFLFSFIHFQFLDFIPRFVLGLAFGYVVILTGSLWYSIILHFLNNLLFVTFEFLIKKGVLTYDSFEEEIYGVFLAIIAFVALGYSFFRLNKNNNLPEVKGIYLR